MEFTDFITRAKNALKKGLEMPGIDPGTSRMLSERSTIWATPPSMATVNEMIDITLAMYQTLL